MAAPCPVVHFQMPYRDPARMKTFYETAFGWKTQTLGPEMGSYVLAETTETENGRPTTPGAIGGGFFAQPPEGGAGPSIVIAVPDIHAAVEAVRAAGGTPQSGPMEIPGVGQFVPIRDTEGNEVGMLQPIMPG